MGSDGAIILSTVPAGTYTFKDVASGKTAPVEIVTGETTSVVVLRMTGGDTGQATGSQSASTGTATVSQLPNTGAGPLGKHGVVPISLLALATVALAIWRRQRAA